jgi:uronate dehydrogenase
MGGLSGSGALPRVLLTGAGGGIGRCLHRALAGRYPLLRLVDRVPVAALHATDDVLAGDLRDPAVSRAAVQGIDCVVHLAGIPKESTWDEILPNNIVATVGLFEAARAAGVRRYVFASSNHAIGYHDAARDLGIDEPPRPDSRYGVSKVFGEALCRMYADKYAVDACCLRIGSFRERPEDARQLSTWIGHRDMVELVRCAIEAPQYGFAIVYGVSANARVKWHSPDAARIGYQPTQDAGQWAAELAQVAVGAPGSAAVRFHGGSFCANGHIDRDGGSDRGDRDG